MNQQPGHSSKSFANAARGLRHVFVNRLALSAHIGIHPHERAAAQTIWVSLDAAVAEGEAGPDSIADVVCYEAMSKQVSAIVAEGHIDLVETLADRIADALLRDSRIRQVRVQVEKPEAIERAQSVGIAIERLQTG